MFNWPYEMIGAFWDHWCICRLGWSILMSCLKYNTTKDIKLIIGFKNHGKQVTDNKGITEESYKKWKLKLKMK